MEADLSHLERYLQRIRMLHHTGLAIPSCFEPVRVWSPSVYVHIVCATPMYERWAQAVDDQLAQILTDLLRLDGKHMGAFQRDLVYLLFRKAITRA